MPYTRQCHPSGFSLLEALLVCTLMAVLVGVSVPQIRQSFTVYRLTASANTVATELNAARTLAISRNWFYEIDCNTTNHTLQIVDPGNANNSPRSVKFLESGITFYEVPGVGSEIRFYSGGHARGGTIVLQNENGDTISILVGLHGAGWVEVQDWVAG